ncbi:MAG: NYN domain-containing protein [Alphaproteobacteria bacterium]
MRIRAYIDGYNLFYGALKSGKIKSSIPEDVKQKIKQSKKAVRWLNVEALISYYLKGDFSLEAINFYTAEVQALFEGDKSPIRQQEYFKALSSIENLSIHKGKFYKHKVSMPLHPVTNPITFANVIKTEEKGSDVNLASHLVFDACQNNFDMAVIVTNDSDLLEPIKIVTQLNKKILILCPHSNICYDFIQEFTSKVIRKIDMKALRLSQFDDVIKDDSDNIIATRPTSWQED